MPPRGRRLPITCARAQVFVAGEGPRSLTPPLLWPRYLILSSVLLFKRLFNPPLGFCPPFLCDISAKATPRTRLDSTWTPKSPLQWDMWGLTATSPPPQPNPRSRTRAPRLLRPASGPFSGLLPPWGKAPTPPAWVSPAPLQGSVYV